MLKAGNIGWTGLSAGIRDFIYIDGSKRHFFEQSDVVIDHFRLK